MKSLFSASALVFAYIMLFALSSCSTQDDMAAKPAPPAAPAPVAKAEKAPPAEKATAEKAAGESESNERWPVMLVCSISKKTI